MRYGLKAVVAKSAESLLNHGQSKEQFNKRLGRRGRVVEGLEFHAIPIEI